ISIKINKSFDAESNSILNFIQKKYKNIILNIGSFTTQKNQIDLIEAFTKIEYLQNVCLILVGKGPQKEDVYKTIINKKIEKNVFLFDFKNNIDPFFSIATLYVSTSLWEGFPNILLDAASHNIPIIAYDCDFGPSEILENEKYGKLCKINDKDKLLKLIEFGLSNKIKIIPNKILQSRYSLDQIGQKYENLI
ncbi:glycosyltransferase, partial [Alphaproteobacteria bacterium]|nr:glycosyltransferase [Alphaproteobacteria bacterium]